MKLTSKSIDYTVNTVDELLSLSGEENQTVVVTDENRGGTFVYRSANATINNTGTIFSGWSRVYDGAVNVKWFGNDIQSAINSGDSELLISDDCSFSDLVLASNQRLIGKTGVKITGNSITLSSYSGISNLSIDFSNSVGINSLFTTGTIKSCIVAENTKNSSIENCTILNIPTTTSGISIYNGNRCNISGNTMIGGYRAIIISYASIECFIVKNKISNTSDNAILIHTSTGNKSGGHIVESNNLSNIGNHGIMMWSMDGDATVQVRDVYNCKIIGNTIDTTINGAGIWCSVCKDIFVSLNTLKYIYMEGIDFEGSLDCIASNNILYNSSTGFGALTAFFGSKRCNYIANTIVFDGDFPLLGGGHHPKASSIAIYFRDDCEDMHILGNSISAINSNGKISEINTYHGNTTNHSSTATQRLYIANNILENVNTNLLDTTDYCEFKYNKISMTILFYNVIKSVNSISTIVINNEIRLIGVSSTTTTAADAMIFFLCNRKPQTVVKTIANNNTITDTVMGITFSTWFSGVSNNGNFVAKDNLCDQIDYSKSVASADMLTSSNYKYSDYTATTLTGV